MRVGEIIAECKIHGESIHRIYSYKGGSSMKCLACAREETKRRRENPETRLRDLSYTKKWADLNRERIKEKAKEKRIEEMLLKQAKVYKFVKENKEEIYHLLAKFNSGLGLRDIRKYCLHYNILDLELIKSHIISNKRSQLYKDEIYKQSSLIKYHLRIRETYLTLPEKERKEIRKKYKEKANTIVDQKIKELQKVL